MDLQVPEATLVALLLAPPGAPASCCSPRRSTPRPSRSRSRVRMALALVGRRLAPHRAHACRRRPGAGYLLTTRSTGRDRRRAGLHRPGCSSPRSRRPASCSTCPAASRSRRPTTRCRSTTSVRSASFYVPAGHHAAVRHRRAPAGGPAASCKLHRAAAGRRRCPGQLGQRADHGVTQMFLAALQIAGPLIVVLFLADVALGAAQPGRAAAQRLPAGLPAEDHALTLVLRRPVLPAAAVGAEHPASSTGTRAMVALKGRVS